MLIPPNVPSIEVDASDVLDDGNLTQENSFKYVPSYFGWHWSTCGRWAQHVKSCSDTTKEVEKEVEVPIPKPIGNGGSIPTHYKPLLGVSTFQRGTFYFTCTACFLLVYGCIRYLRGEGHHKRRRRFDAMNLQPSALTPDEVKERVAQARKAQKIWAKSSFKQRRQFLRILLKFIIEHQELICEISSRDTGKTMVDASLGEIMTTCEKITWLLSEGERWLKPEYRCSGRSMLHKKSKVEFHPLGDIGAIVSWNYPFHNIFNPMLAAVFSGNSIVIKVSEHASWSGCFYFRIIQSALAAVGAPENLVDVITGFAETGEALVSSVDKIIFVGSPGVGKMIMRNAAEMLIPVTLELGGKDAFIVCEDADVERVAQIAVRAVLQSSGQNCAGAERFYVHKEIYSSFVSQVSKIVKSVTAGPPLAGKYDMGAICLQEHSERLQNLVNDALDRGAKFVVWGSVGHMGEGAVDQFFPPTVIENVNHTMKLMQEEAFGPIMPIMKFSTDEEVVKLANDSKYGLGCAVFSGSQRRAKEIASQIHCGVAAINDFASTYMCQSLPFGSVKDSGFGRFAGVEGLRACCLVKSVVEDRWWPYIKTKIPKPIQYPVGENGFEFQESLVEALYGMNIWDHLRALVNVLKILTEQNSPANSKRRDD